jgi:hypothetical protein
MVGGHTLRELRVPELHHQLFLIAIMKARQKQYGESMYGEPYTTSYIGNSRTRGPYARAGVRRDMFVPPPSHPFYNH